MTPFVPADQALSTHGVQERFEVDASTLAAGFIIIVSFRVG
jgi:hypothetical protein